MKQRNVSVDILKCIAALAITNSHMDILYPCGKALATGGLSVMHCFFSVPVLLFSWDGREDLTIGISGASTVYILQFLHGPLSGHSFFKMTMA